MRDKLLSIIRDSLKSIKHPRFFESERGFQGEFLAEIKKRLGDTGWAAGKIVEQEYQKRFANHGLKIRPDLIIHSPFEPRLHENRKEGNSAVIEIKLKANEKKALEDYNNLSKMCEHLDYPLAFFINIGAVDTFLDKFNGPFKERMVAFSICLIDGEIKLSEQWAT